nr:MAG TPA: hypothetical protein [Caudoviricetes sp.]
MYFLITFKSSFIAHTSWLVWCFKLCIFVFLNQIASYSYNNTVIVVTKTI